MRGVDDQERGDGLVQAMIMPRRCWHTQWCGSVGVLRPSASCWPPSTQKTLESPVELGEHGPVPGDHVRDENPKVLFVFFR